MLTLERLSDPELGVTHYFLDPYQIGHENAAAIRDYQKYLELAGSRATDRPAVVRALRRLGVEVEEP